MRGVHTFVWCTVMVARPAGPSTGAEDSCKEESGQALRPGRDFRTPELRCVGTGHSLMIRVMRKNEAGLVVRLDAGNLKGEGVCEWIHEDSLEGVLQLSDRLP